MSNSKNQLVSNFDIDDFIVEPVKSFKTKKGIQMTRSYCKYAHKNGPGIVLIRGPKSFCPMGFSPQWELNLPKEKRNDSNISNWSTLISLHGHEDEERDIQKIKEGKKFAEMCNEIYHKGYDTVMEPKNLALVGGSAKIMLKVGIEGFKQIVFPSKIIEDKKNPGEMKKIGPSMNAKLMWNKEDNTFQTKVMGPTGWVSPTVFRGVPGEIEPIYWIDNIFIGGHGTASYGASYQIKLWMCNYYPSEKGGPKPSEEDGDMLLPHTAPAIDLPASHKGSDDEGDTGYISHEDLAEQNNDPPEEEVDVTTKLQNMTSNDSEEENEEEEEIKPAKPKKPVKKPVRRKVVSKK